MGNRDSKICPYTWDERIEDFISLLCYKVKGSNVSPFPNKIFESVSLLSTLIILFFLKHENNNDDIFVQIKNRAKDITSKEIVETEFNYWIENFQPIKKLLLEYLIIQENDIRTIHITNLVEKCNLFFEEILKSEKIIHLIPFTTTFAIVHFTVLREFLKLQTVNNNSYFLFLFFFFFLFFLMTNTFFSQILGLKSLKK
jgi:hypothetical protein